MSGEQHNEHAAERRPSHKGARLMLRARHLLIHREADEDGERKTVEFARHGPAPHAIPATHRHRGVCVLLLSPRHRGRIVDRIPGVEGIPGSPHPKDTVGAEKPEHAMLAQLSRFIAADEIICTDGYNHDAVKGTLRITQSAAEL